MAALLLLSAAQSLPAAGGCNRDYSALRLDELQRIADGEQIDGTIDEAKQTAAQRLQSQQAASLLESRHRVADKFDLAIINHASALLPSDKTWNRKDNRQCPSGAPTVSLFCALQQASLEVTGTYEHRRTALQEVRFALEDRTRGKAYEHRLRDFNNDPATRLKDVQDVLTTARAAITWRLARQEACAL